jgi:hypothetical protein
MTQKAEMIRQSSLLYHDVRCTKNNVFLACHDSPVDTLDVFLTELLRVNLIQLSRARGTFRLLVNILGCWLFVPAHGGYWSEC